jgi:hypothetical protein
VRVWERAAACVGRNEQLRASVGKSSCAVCFPFSFLTAHQHYTTESQIRRRIIRIGNLLSTTTNVSVILAAILAAIFTAVALTAKTNEGKKNWKCSASSILGQRNGKSSR